MSRSWHALTGRAPRSSLGARPASRPAIAALCTEAEPRDLPGLDVGAAVGPEQREQIDVGEGNRLPLITLIRTAVSTRAMGLSPTAKSDDLLLDIEDDAFDRALAGFAATYADVNERDYNQLVEAIKTGIIPAVADT